MFPFFKRSQNKAAAPVPKEALEARLAKSRKGLTDRLFDAFLGQKAMSQELLSEVKHVLIAADFGVEVTESILKELPEVLSRRSLSDPSVVHMALKSCLLKRLPEGKAQELALDSPPSVLLVIGVNGVGKTTTIAKLAQRYAQQGKSVCVAAGDTFRAAAIEQLQVWGERLSIPIIAQQPGADSAAVVFDAWHSAKAKGHDLLIADTAGRLHNKDHLMAELTKIKKVLAKQQEGLPQECFLVLDATTGQAGLDQVKKFKDVLPISGIVLTKLDGTARGGIVFNIIQQFDLPIRFIGVGEQAHDLRLFDPEAFVDALLMKSQRNDSV